jgi:hypothetical protein
MLPLVSTASCRPRMDVMVNAWCNNWRSGVSERGVVSQNEAWRLATLAMHLFNCLHFALTSSTTPEYHALLTTRTRSAAGSQPRTMVNRGSFAR